MPQRLQKRAEESFCSAPQDGQERPTRRFAPQPEQKSEPEVTTAPKPKAGPPPKKTPAVKGQTVFQPIEVPPLPISADKQQRLAELLRKYRADELTPEQYHEERAKVLAEP